MYTTHGEHIPGTKLGNNPPVRAARCGGISSCSDCEAEAYAVSGKISYTQEDMTIEVVREYICKAGVDLLTATLVITNMRMRGIVFRERAKA